MTTDYKFDGQRLIPIESPIPDKADYEAGLKALGFPDSRYAHKMGSDFGVHVEVLGPAKGEQPYAFAVFYTNGAWEFTIWCESFVELHAYLLHVAPLITAVEVDAIRNWVECAYDWTFSSHRGIFREHVHYHESMNRAAARRVKP